MKKSDIKKSQPTGQRGGLACKARYGVGFYSRIASEAHARRRKLLEKVDKGVHK